MKRMRREYQRLCLEEGVDLLGISMRGGHCRWQFAAGIVVAASTPSDWRNLMNVRSQIRRLHR